MGFIKIKYYLKKLDLVEEIEIVFFLIIKFLFKIEFYM